ncbi:hypothetical protein AVEN_118772-1 [Araneus ventricosus]|uniref:Uncharacterized protein n=1 Tax=Araneus ventricosus TaxID=182803 RepID=A0A4Y2BXN4_ARAVE|nr:hypothetical protein AVEN_118772-1 [Araneus ventricosus]
MDRMRWPNFLATKISRRHSTGFFLLVSKTKSTQERSVLLKTFFASIIIAIATVTTEMLQRTWLELDYRLDILGAAKGAHVEVH